MREVGALLRLVPAPAARASPTLTIDTQIGFRSAADRAAFADDLTAAVLDLAAPLRLRRARTGSSSLPTPSLRKAHDHHPDRPVPPRVQRRGAGTPRGPAGDRHRHQGISRHVLLPTEIEEREGGSLHISMGPETGSLTAMSPSGTRRAGSSTRRTAGCLDGGRSPAATSPLTSEFLVEAQSWWHRGARDQQWLRDRGRLGVGVLGRHVDQLDAVLHNLRLDPGALPRTGGHPSLSGDRLGIPGDATANWLASRGARALATRASRSRCAAPLAPSSGSATWRSRRR